LCVGALDDELVADACGHSIKGPDHVAHPKARQPRQTAREVLTNPAREPGWQRRNDNLVNLLAAKDLLHGRKGIGVPDLSRHCYALGAQADKASVQAPARNLFRVAFHPDQLVTYRGGGYQEVETARAFSKTLSPTVRSRCSPPRV
jgi:hypothetical protein